MFSILFIENDDKDLGYAVRRVRDSGLAPLDLHVILIENDDVTDADVEETRTELGISSVHLIPQKGLTYAQLLAETVKLVRRYEPDIVIVDLQLLLHDATLRLCTPSGFLEGESAYEGVQ